MLFLEFEMMVKDNRNIWTTNFLSGIDFVIAKVLEIYKEEIYRTRATVTRSWLETALEYWPYIRPQYINELQRLGKKYTNRGL